MLKFNTILHPTDFSEHAAYALKFAQSLAKDHGAKVILLSVAQTIVAYGSELGPVVMETDAYFEACRKQLEEVAATVTAVEFESRLEKGSPGPEILRVAEELNVDLIVMGTHGRSGLRRLLVGSVTEEIIRNAKCPVVTVKSQMTLRDDAAP